MIKILDAELKKAPFESWVFLSAAAMMTALAAAFIPFSMVMLLIFVGIIYFGLYKYLPVFAALGILGYLISVNAAGLWYIILLTTLLCFVYPILCIIKDRAIDVFSPWFFIPTLYWIFLVLGLAILLLTEMGFNDLHDNSILGGMSYIYAIGILVYYLALWLTTRQLKGGIDKKKAGFIDQLRFRSIFPYYILIHIMLLLYFFIAVKNLPIFMSDPYQARIDVINVVTGYVYSIIKLVIYFAPLYSFYYLSLKNGDISIKRKAVLFFSYSFLLMLTFGWRSDPLTMVLFLVAGYHILVKPLRAKSIIFSGVFGFAFLVTSDCLRMGNDFTSILPVLNMFYATLYVDSLNLVLILENIPQYFDFQHGKLLLAGISALLPGNDLGIGEILRDQLSLGEGGGGMTPTIFGEWYVNFGYPGIFIGIFILGIISGKSYAWMIRNDDFFSKFIYIMILYKVFICIRTGILASILYWLIIIMFIFIRHWCLSSAGNREFQPVDGG